jgi:hypothetical protein
MRAILKAAREDLARLEMGRLADEDHLAQARAEIADAKAKLAALNARINASRKIVP